MTSLPAAQSEPATDAPPNCAASTGSVSVGRGQRAAAQVWNAFKAEECRYVDLIEMCAVLMCNVADKSQSTDHEIAQLTGRLMHDIRRNASSQNRPK